MTTIATSSSSMLTTILGNTNLEITSSNFYRFGDSFAIPNNFLVGYVDVRYIIFTFFLLSCLFQALDGCLGTYTGAATSHGPRLLRFVEYSFSASIMAIAIALEMGINDIYTLCCIFIIIFATNILGLIAESLVYIIENSKNDLLAPGACPGLFIHPIYWWTVPHFLSWIICLVGYAPLLDAYISSTACSDKTPPGFVNVIVFLEFCLFICFGLIQLYSLSSKTALLLHQTSYGNVLVGGGGMNQDDNNDDEFGINNEDPSHQITLQADYAYIILSFTAKTLLAWLILAPTL